MTANQPSVLARAMTWLVVALCVGFTGLGIYWHGFSWEVHQRFWQNIFDRAHGPMTFRLFLQPTMAFIAALADGIKDVRLGHKSFFWSGMGDPTVQHGRLRQGLNSTARVALLGFCMDAIYQLRVLDQFFPAESVMMVLLLAVIPYFVFRWLVEGVARWWLARKSGPVS